MTRILTASLVVLAAIASAACTPLARSSFDSLRQLASSTDLRIDTSQLAADTAYALATVGGNKLLIGRGKSRDFGQDTWYTATNQVFIFEQGLLVQTVGLPEDLQRVSFATPHPLQHEKINMAALALPALVTRHISRSGLAVEQSTYRLQSCGHDTMSTWSQTRDVICLDEELVSSTAATPLPGSRYWLDKTTGEWVSSVQWISPTWSLRMSPRPNAPASTESLTPFSVLPAGQHVHSLVAVAPTRLSRLLLDFPLKQPAQAGAAWLTMSQLPAQQALKRGVLFDLDQQLARVKHPAEKAQLRLWRDRIAAQPATGRVALPVLQPRWLQVNPREDVVLNGGDQLLRSVKSPTSVSLMGALPVTCHNDLSVTSSISQLVAACLQGTAMPDTVWRISVQGQTQLVSVAAWNHEAVDAHLGDRIWIPLASLSEAANADIAKWLATQPDLSSRVEP
ncbi:MAG: YjbF family lipoprotein [Pseudomonadota bacterium]